jgi:AcrR family transcriptional regulator
MRPSGRRPGNPDTDSEILSAAREVFGELGYDRTTIRGISKRAGVDPALIYHYFENKAKLYTASISLPFAPADAVDEVFSGDNRDVGRQLANILFTVWDHEESRSSLLGILRSAMGGESQAVAAFREYMVETLKERIAPRI